MKITEKFEQLWEIAIQQNPNLNTPLLKDAYFQMYRVGVLDGMYLISNTISSIVKDI